jgi:hypothetical protein
MLHVANSQPMDYAALPAGQATVSPLRQAQDRPIDRTKRLPRNGDKGRCPRQKPENHRSAVDSGSKLVPDC